MALEKFPEEEFDEMPVPILLIEDDSVEVEIVRDILEKADIQNPIYRVCDGMEALEVLYGHTVVKRLPQPCVLLLDLNMPRMDGLEFLERIHGDAILRQNIVFVLTTSDRNEDKTQAYKLGVSGYILKNNLHELADMLRTYCRINKFPIVK